MLLRISAIALFVCATSVSSTSAQENLFKCPNKTKYRKVKVSPQIAEKPNYPQYEEYCQKKEANGIFSKEGPYRLWGPNSEKLEEGQYLNGKREGKWVRWIPSQILEDTWSKGNYIEGKILGTPSSYTIDFGSCTPHEYGIPAVFGSTLYKLTGKKGNYCKLSYSIEIEMGQGPQVSCIVPTSKGSLVFFNTEMGINFSNIEQYCKR